MFDWKDIPKIDAHVHLITDEMYNYYKDDQDDSVWKYSNIEFLKEMADKYNITKFILQPTNDTRMYYDTDKTNEWLSSICNENKDLFLAFADIQNEGSYLYDIVPKTLEKAIRDYKLVGLKIHPNNLNIPIDDLSMIPVLRKAAELKIPIMIHSNPTSIGGFDYCSPSRISNIMRIFPDITFITAHMGGSEWLSAIDAVTYVDISYVLLKYVNLYGIKQTNRILRSFGVERLIFGTDFPQTYDTHGNDVYKEYIEILNQMDFTEDEAYKICTGNITKILNL